MFAEWETSLLQQSRQTVGLSFDSCDQHDAIAEDLQPYVCSARSYH